MGKCQLITKVVLQWSIKAEESEPKVKAEFYEINKSHNISNCNAFSSSKIYFYMLFYSANPSPKISFQNLWDSIALRGMHRMMGERFNGKTTAHTVNIHIENAEKLCY